jgi:hypothetical protein
MARGFESKDVEFQQAERERAASSGRELRPFARALQDKRRTLELALMKVRSERQAATHPNHLKVLDAAILSLEEEIRRLVR